MNDKSDNKNYEQNNINNITNALINYDKSQVKYRDTYINIAYISIESTSKDLEHNVIIMYDSELKEIFRSRYERIGIFHIKIQMWTWAWAIPYLKKNETTIIRKILSYGTELDPEVSNLKAELITSRFKVTNKIQLDLYCAIASYLSKKQRIFNYRIFGNPKILENKYVNIIEPDTLNDNSFDDMLSYIFLLD